jgi:hypothetical protein
MSEQTHDRLMTIAMVVWCLAAFLSGAGCIAVAAISFALGEWLLGVLFIPLGLLMWFGSYAYMFGAE